MSQDNPNIISFLAYKKAKEKKEKEELQKETLSVTHTLPDRSDIPDHIADYMEHIAQNLAGNDIFILKVLYRQQYAVLINFQGILDTNYGADEKIPDEMKQHRQLLEQDLTTLELIIRSIDDCG